MIMEVMMVVMVVVQFWRPFDFPGNTFTEAPDNNCSLPMSSDEEETSLFGPDI